ncbi:hypothetical protein AAF712_013394, partial [Marasmius tenuissimus]
LTDTYLDYYNREILATVDACITEQQMRQSMGRILTADELSIAQHLSRPIVVVDFVNFDDPIRTGKGFAVGIPAQIRDALATRTMLPQDLAPMFERWRRSTYIEELYVITLFPGKESGVMAVDYSFPHHLNLEED